MIGKNIKYTSRPIHCYSESVACFVCIEITNLHCLHEKGCKMLVIISFDISNLNHFSILQLITLFSISEFRQWLMSSASQHPIYVSLFVQKHGL